MGVEKQYVTILAKLTTNCLRSHFELETTSGCSYDQVMVFNGPSKSHPLLGKFCGSFRPADVITTSNRMLMTFQSDDSNERTGFLAVFISIAPRIAG